MKRIILILLLLPSLAWGGDLGQDYARMNPYILGGAAAALSCAATPYESAETDSNNITVKNSTPYTYGGQTAYTVSGATSLCRLDVLYDTIVGDVSSLNYYAEVWSMTTTSLNSRVCQSAAVTGIASTGWKQFDFSGGCDLSAATNYAVVLTHDGTNDSFNGNNYIRISVTSSTGMAGTAANWKTDKTEMAAYGTYEAAFKYYKME